MSNRTAGWAICVSMALVIVLGCAVYANSLRGAFVYDDTGLVSENAYIKDWSNITKLFTENIFAGHGIKSTYYRPLQMITYVADYSLWGFNVTGYHLTNILLHILAALSVLWLINILSGDKLISALTALLFVTHPIHTEAVAYISGRAEMLYAAFVILCFIFYLKYHRSKSILTYITMLVCFILALLSKESAVVLLPLIILYHFAFKKKINLKAFLAVTFITLSYLFLRFMLLSHLRPDARLDGNIIQRIPRFLAAVVNYIKLLIMPFDLRLHYGSGSSFGFLDPVVLLGAAMIAVFLLYGFQKRHTKKLVSFGIFWFFASLLPVSGIIRLKDYMLEHWLYLPSVGFFLLAAIALAFLSRKKGFRILVVLFTTALLLFYSGITIIQNSFWRNPVVFYKRLLRYAPENENIEIRTNLANTYVRLKKYEESIPLYKEIIKVLPNDPKAYNGLGNAYFAIGETKKATALYIKAIGLDPYFAATYNNLGRVYFKEGRNQEAIELFKQAIAINPNHGSMHSNLAEAYYRAEQHELALRHAGIARKFGYNVHPKFLRLFNKSD